MCTYNVCYHLCHESGYTHLCHLCDTQITIQLGNLGKFWAAALPQCVFCTWKHVGFFVHLCTYDVCCHLLENCGYTCLCHLWHAQITLQLDSRSKFWAAALPECVLCTWKHVGFFVPVYTYDVCHHLLEGCSYTSLCHLCHTHKSPFT